MIGNIIIVLNELRVVEDKFCRDFLGWKKGVVNSKNVVVRCYRIF